MSDEGVGTAPRVAGRRVLVVGASKGIGRATAVALAAAGARVVAAARDTALLADVAAAAGPPSVRAVGVDVRDPAMVEDLVAGAVDHLGGLDALLYATGVNELAFLADTGPAQWATVLETNLVGAALVTRAALPALRASGGRIGLLSSHSVADPWPGLGAYVASKAALDSMVATWRLEEPTVAFTRIVIGPTITGMAEAWDPELSAHLFERWHAEGRFDGIEPVLPEVVAGVLVDWVGTALPPPDLHLLDP